ncbi:MAG TPA: DsbE family thiol:disulfide interchange protein [Sphingomicrobium sp.]|nr:DsbE family thiol:disulfide interchange protein [Sphingomicrobium sp.]
MSRAIRFAPLALLVVIIAALVWRLATPADTSVHSTMIGRAVPRFLPVAATTKKMDFSSSDLARGRPHLVNFFASWCVPCIGEAKVLENLERHGVSIYGIAVRDRPDDLGDFLERNGDPYQLITSDPQSDVQIEFGSSGVPESFIVDGRGIIRYQHIGPIEPSDVPMILSKFEQAR